MSKKKWECIAEQTFSGDIVITDPTYLNLCGSPEDIQKRIGKKGIVSTTFYGDWGCTVYRTDTSVGHILKRHKEIGRFCADSGQVCVMKMEDALKYCSDFDNWLKEHDWCGTIIRWFDGKVRFMTKTNIEKMPDGKTFKDVELHVRGDGRICTEKASFESIQTSL